MALGATHSLVRGVSVLVEGVLSEALIGTGKFNGRVEECLTAGALLWEQITGERTAACPLGRIARADWERCEGALPAVYRRRAAHYFGEAARVAEIAAELEGRYLRQFPRFAGSLWAFSTSAGPGLQLA